MSITALCLHSDPGLVTLDAAIWRSEDRVIEHLIRAKPLGHPTEVPTYIGVRSRGKTPNIGSYTGIRRPHPPLAPCSPHELAKRPGCGRAPHSVVRYWRASSRQGGTLSVGVEFAKVEVLEEMCRQDGISTIAVRAGCSLSQPERNLLMRKYLEGRYSFPISDSAGNEGIKLWLSNPLINLTYTSVVVDTATMESMLRKVFQEKYEHYYRLAQARLWHKKQAL